MNRATTFSAMRSSRRILVALFLLLLLFSLPAFAQTKWQTEWSQRWKRRRRKARSFSAFRPASNCVKRWNPSVKKKLGFEMEIVPAAAGRKWSAGIADEYHAGVRYFDVIISTFDNLEHSLIPMGAVDPLEAHWILPEVREAKNWWGGHIWTDNSKRFAYSPFAFMQDNIWYNSDLVKAEEIRVYDDLLKPKWKGKIGLWDPRQGGASAGKWAFLWATKGEGYLKKLTEQVGSSPASASKSRTRSGQGHHRAQHRPDLL